MQKAACERRIRDCSSGVCSSDLVAVGVAMLTVFIPKATGSTSLTVLTGSMSPAIPPGSIVLVKPTDPSTIEAGEVITYQAEPGKAAYVTHRVVEVDRKSVG